MSDIILVDSDKDHVQRGRSSILQVVNLSICIGVHYLGTSRKGHRWPHVTYLYRQDVDGDWSSP